MHFLKSSRAFSPKNRHHKSWNRPNSVKSSHVFCCAFHCGHGYGTVIRKGHASSLLPQSCMSFWMSNVPLSQYHAYSAEVRIDAEFRYTGCVGFTVLKSCSLTAPIDPCRHPVEPGCRCKHQRPCKNGCCHRRSRSQGERAAHCWGNLWEFGVGKCKGI